MPRYNLDQLAQRIRARDEKRKSGNFNLLTEGVAQMVAGTRLHMRKEITGT